MYVAALLIHIATTEPASLRPVQLVENLVLFATAFTLGHAAQVRREAAAVAQEKAALAEQYEGERARQALSDQRLAIAREVHDLVAHSLGVIAVQAGVGAHVIDTQPQQAKAALEAIAGTSREALGEVRGLLEVLRNADEQVTHDTAGGLADVGTPWWTGRRQRACPSR